jgi:hypothetical protein
MMSARPFFIRLRPARPGRDATLPNAWMVNAEDKEE